MKYTYWLLITIQIAIVTQFIYFEQMIPGFVDVPFNENPIPYELLPYEYAFFTVSYLLLYAVHLIIVEQIFKRRDHTIVWSKAGLRITIQLGFTVFFYFFYIAIFSNLQTRHHIESLLTVNQFFKYRFIITAIMAIPVLICLLMFKIYALGKNTLILVFISGISTLLISWVIYYFETGPLNDIEEERRIITNVLSIDIAIGVMLWRESKRNMRLDKMEP